MTFHDFMTRHGAFHAYAYAYPHKTAYRPLKPSLALTDVWANEGKGGLFLYAHVPFCEMRCGFCNLFTTTHPAAGLVDRYLAAVEREAEAVSRALGAATFSRLVVGGGTPTFLRPDELDRLFTTLKRHFSIAPTAPLAVELSPQTTTADRLDVLRHHGVHRTSLGVQSFVDDEVRQVGRQQSTGEARRALGRLRDYGFPVLNIDLIYGISGQTAESWRRSLTEALAFQPEEIYLYPLYVRPLTGLSRRGSDTADLRPELYRMGRDCLLRHNYRQISMRLFRRQDHGDAGGPEYCCQDDGMVGIGPGARSYTAALHYSSEWAVGRPGVTGIIESHLNRDGNQCGVATYGATLDEDEQRRRFVIKSVLRIDGVDTAHYTSRFGSSVVEDFPCLSELVSAGALMWDGPNLRPSETGLAWSDAIGPWLFSAKMAERMVGFSLR